MRDEYKDWIDKNYPTKLKAKNMCNRAVQEMTLRFIELKVQVGYANNKFHCWCKDEENNIIDPTYRQFEGEIIYIVVAERFLNKDEIETST